MSGFSLSADEVMTVCRRMRAQTDAIPGRAARIGSGETGPSDFGNAHTDLGELYLSVLADAVPRMLHEFQDATTSMSERLEKALGGYADADEDAIVALNRASGGGIAK